MRGFDHIHCLPTDWSVLDEPETKAAERSVLLRALTRLFWWTVAMVFGGAIWWCFIWAGIRLWKP